MGTTVLSAATTIGEIPDYYFQAVGSGTGAIAAWEANMRLNEDGRFGNKTMKLVVSQNAPFVPMFDAWRVDSREMLPYEAAKARRDAEIIDAKVLSNRKPPYSLAGGLYDALKATGGDIMVATNAQARKARPVRGDRGNRYLLCGGNRHGVARQVRGRRADRPREDRHAQHYGRRRTPLPAG